MEIVLARGAPNSLVCLVIVETVQDANFSVTFDNATSLKTESGDVISGTFAIARYLTRVFPQYHLYGNTILEEAQVDHWLEYSVLQMPQLTPSILRELDHTLTTRTYLVGTVLTMADFAVYAQLHAVPLWKKSGADYPHLTRWFTLLGKHLPLLKAVGIMASQQKEVQKEKSQGDRKEGGPRSKMEEGGKFIELPGASEGNVVVRFPPEAGGYLHIGHAKAALLNQYYQLAWKGKLVMRFDDTNPEKEKEEFEKVILEDVDMLGIKPDIFSFTSDHFGAILNHAEDLIKRNLAFVDDNPQEVMAKEREEKRPSANRDRSFEQNWRLWQEMVKGSEIGQKCCLRAKMDPTNDNGCLRDPTLYRCKDTPHPRTATKYKVYPTYDFACPIVDSVEGVTHALRTTEYHDRDPQYYWFIEKLGIRKPYVWEYSRLNLQNTLLSKRKLTWFVEQGLVEGWDDPRMPTVRGVLRRGMTVEGLKEFIIAQGSSRAIVFMEWDKIWAYNRKVIDPVAPRYTAILKSAAVPLLLEGVSEEKGTAQKHPKNLAVGEKDVFYSSKIFLEGEDANVLKNGEKVTLVNWGNAVITGIDRDGSGKVVGLSGRLALDDTDYKNTAKLTWLAETSLEEGQFTPTTLVHYDVLITKPVLKPDDNWKDYVNYDTKKELVVFGDPMLRQLKKGDIIQLQRRGYYICDCPYAPPSRYTMVESPCVLINIPDGHTKTKSTGASEGKGKSGAPRKNKANSPPEMQTPPKKEPPRLPDEEGVSTHDVLSEKITTQGNLVRKLKAEGAEKSLIDAEVKTLLDLKKTFKSETGKEWSAPKAKKEEKGVAKAKKEEKGVAKAKKEEKGVAKAKKEKTVPKEEKKVVEADRTKALPEESGAAKKNPTTLGIQARKEKELSEWYSQVITRSEMIEYYDVSGCYVLRPWSYSIWEVIKDFFDASIKKLGVENCYFPIFVSKAALEREKEHIADFAPEVAWVTKSGQSDMAEPIAIRPTSETVMYPAYAKWVQSHRDLPIKLNQWNNVVRWEFKHPQPFLRTREFLWQEGHTAYANKPEAEEEVKTILELYSRVYEELLAVPVIKGKKSMKEKFAGSDYSLTVEGYVAASGRGIQGATSHHLGQNFSKMFDIGFEDPETSERCHVYQNSWGLTTRTIGVMVLVHGDNKGLVLPPRVACIQVVIVPCGVTAQLTSEERAKIVDHCDRFCQQLKAGGIKTHLDDRENYSPGWKFNDWEMRGVPMRVEIGPKDIESSQVMTVCRDTGVKKPIKIALAVETIRTLLDDMQKRMFEKAKSELDSHIKVATKWDDFVTYLDQKNIILAPFCLQISCEDDIKRDSQRAEPSESGGALMGAKSLCIPFTPPKPVEKLSPTTKCVKCEEVAKAYTMFGRSY